MFGDHLTDSDPTLAAIEGAAMVSLYAFGRTCPSGDGFAHLGVIQSATNANDHENHLQLIENECQQQ